MKKIVIFSDSLALPRNFPEETLLEDTYPYKLSSDYKVFQCSIGGGRILDLVKQIDYYKQYRPDYVILQSGIVDCAPRAFSWNEELFMQSNFVGRCFRYLIEKTITTKSIRNLRKKSWTSTEDYSSSCKTIKNAFSCPVFAFSIIPSNKEYETKVPGITKKIEQYNHLLVNVFGSNVVHLDNIPRKGVMSDGHHLTTFGHEYVYRKLIERLNNKL